MNARLHRSPAVLATVMAVTLGIGFLASGQTAQASGPASIGLGKAGPFAVLAGTPKVTNSGPTMITGNLGIYPALAVTGFPPGTVSGSIHLGDTVAQEAKADFLIAYGVAFGLPSTATHAQLGALTLVGGVYTAGGATLDLTGTLTLDGANDPNAVWVFKATSDLVTAPSSTVRLINGAQACHVFWQVTSSANLKTSSTIVGTILAHTSITIGDGVKLDGRALAYTGDVTLINDTIAPTPCAGPRPTPTATATSTPTPTATATLRPGATPTPTSRPGATATPSGGAALPATDTLPGTGGSGSGLPVVLAVLLGAALVSLLSLRTVSRTRNR